MPASRPGLRSEDRAAIPAPRSCRGIAASPGGQCRSRAGVRDHADPAGARTAEAQAAHAAWALPFRHERTVFPVTRGGSSFRPQPAGRPHFGRPDERPHAIMSRALRHGIRADRCLSSQSSVADLDRKNRDEARDFRPFLRRNCKYVSGSIDIIPKRNILAQGWRPAPRRSTLRFVEENAFRSVGTKIFPSSYRVAQSRKLETLHVNNIPSDLRRKSGRRPPLLLVISWCVATIAIWAAVNSEAGRLVWWW